MEIFPVGAFRDNYIWVLAENGRAVCIDPGEAEPAAAFLHERGLVLEQIWITHHHNDHTGGIAALQEAFPGCTVYGAADIERAQMHVTEGSRIAFGTAEALVWHTPGHTGSHMSYLLCLSDGLHVFCGDTLFAAGCGRVFTGTVSQLCESLHRFNGLEPDTLFYPAHEYTAANLRFAAHIEPHNPHIRDALAKADAVPTLPVMLAHERQTNPFLRTGQPQVAARARELSGRACHGEEAVFAALRELKNGF